MKIPPIVSPQEWQAARAQLLVKEKELTRARDALAAERRRMSWMAVEKDYRFEGPERQNAPSRRGTGRHTGDRVAAPIGGTARSVQDQGRLRIVDTSWPPVGAERGIFSHQ